MKDSGIEWIGEIPDDWQTGKIKNVLSSYCSGATPDSSKEEYYDDNGTPWVVIADMSESDFIFDTAKHITEKAISDKHLTIIHAGAILYAMYASVGKVSELMIDATVNQAILALQFDLDKAGSQFMKFFLQACEPYVRAESNGTTQFNLNAGKVVNLSIAYPSLPKQKSIERYLDKKCAEIDRLIAHEEAMIDELKAYKQSVITEAVTKGLDCSVPMKDSGVEWIGEIPEDWKVSRIKYFCKIINGFPFDSNDFGRDLSFKVVRIGDIQNDTVDWENCVSVSINNIKNCNLRKGDAIIALSGATVGKTAFINDEIKDCYINQRVAIIRSTHIKYILYTLKTIGFAEYVTLSSSGSAQPNLSTGQMGNYYLLVSDNQDLIVNFLERKCSEIDRLISLKHAKIEELRDYKKSLIYEYVTGKKEVV